MENENWKENTGAGLHRTDWTPSFTMVPEDYSLAVSNLRNVPPRLLEVYARFFRVGWIHEFGNKCFLMSYLLRRVLRLHGIEAHCKQMIVDYKKEERGWSTNIGQHNSFVPENSIDSHCVVVSCGYILDFSLIKPIHYEFGALAPAACVIPYDPKYFGEWYDVGFFGEFSYTPRSNHKMTKHVVFDQRERVIEKTKDYFDYFQM